MIGFCRKDMKFYNQKFIRPPSQYPVFPGNEQYFKLLNSNVTQLLIYIFNFRHMYAIDSNQYLKEKHEFHISHAYLGHTSRDPSHSSSHQMIWNQFKPA